MVGMWDLLLSIIVGIFAVVFGIMALLGCWWLIFAFIWATLLTIEKKSMTEFVPSGKKTIMFVAFVFFGIPFGIVLTLLYQWFR